jgi:RND family efflux transporter MFP subunit
MPLLGPVERTLAAAALAATCFCSREKLPPAAQEAPKARVRISVAPVRSAAGSARTSGSVAARHPVEILSRHAAAVTRLAVSEGDRVRPGQLLLLLDDRDARARLAAAEAGARSARAEKARIEGLLSRDAATARESEQASAAAEAAEAAAAQARAALAYLRITAPSRGRVVSVPVHEGDVVQPGQRLLVVEAEGGHEVRATLDAEASSRVRPGDSLPAHVDGIPEALPARVRSISSAADPQTHRFLLRADLPADDRLRSGLFAWIELPAVASTSPRLVVPSAAVFDRGGLTGVFVVEGERARLRWIATGRREGSSTEVRAGLREGETVVLDPRGLSDGTRVTVSP